MAVVGFYLFFGGIIAVGIGERENFGDFLVGFGLSGYFVVVYNYLCVEYLLIDALIKIIRNSSYKYISKTAQVTTDQWKGYKPIRDFDITQIPSNNGKNFPTLHKVIHQVKSWIRGIYSWVSEFNIDRYLAEYSFRINRSQNKDTIFNKLMKRIVERSPVSQSQLVCS